MLDLDLDKEKVKEYALIMTYFTSLFITTCFFFNPHKVVIFNTTIQLPIGLTFFPLTFAISNIIQDKFGKTSANSLVLVALIFDTLLVFSSYFLSKIGDRVDYATVFADMPHIMISTWFFLGVASIFNVVLYAYLKKFESDSIFSMLSIFFITISATEILISLMSMPLMYYKHGLTGNITLTIILIVIYKILANFIITGLYGTIFIKKT